MKHLVTTIQGMYKKCTEFGVKKAEKLMPTPRKVKKVVGQHSPLIIKPHSVYNLKLTQVRWYWSRTESVTTKQRAL